MIRKLFSFTKFIVLASLFALNASLSADAQGYRNPIIYADVPDMSICRVGDYYYLISTTMHLMPGAPVMPLGNHFLCLSSHRRRTSL